MCFCLEDTGVNLFLVFSDSRGCLLPIFKEHDLNLHFYPPVCSLWLADVGTFFHSFGWGFPFPSGGWSLSLQWVIHTDNPGSPSHLLEPTVQPLLFGLPLFLPCPFTFSKTVAASGPRSMLHPFEASPIAIILWITSFGK